MRNYTYPRWLIWEYFWFIWVTFWPVYLSFWFSQCIHFGRVVNRTHPWGFCGHCLYSDDVGCPVRIATAETRRFASCTVYHAHQRKTDITTIKWYRSYVRLNDVFVLAIPDPLDTRDQKECEIMFRDQSVPRWFADCLADGTLRLTSVPHTATMKVYYNKLNKINIKIVDDYKKVKYSKRPGSSVL